MFAKAGLSNTAILKYATDFFPYPLIELENQRCLGVCRCHGIRPLTCNRLIDSVRPGKPNKQFTRSNSTIEALEKFVRYVQS